MTPKIGDLIGAAAGVVVFAQGAAEHRWPAVADKAFPFAALVLLVIFGGALSAQWRSVESIARINRTSRLALTDALGACLRLGVAPAIWVVLALLAIGFLFAWNAVTLRLAVAASMLGIVILIGGLVHYAIVVRRR